MPALRAAVPAALVGLVLLLAGCGSGPVTNVHSADGAEVLAHTEEGGSEQAGEPGTGETEGETEGQTEGQGADGETQGEEAPATEAPAAAGDAVDDAFLRALREESVRTLLLAEKQIASGQDPEATALARRVAAQLSAEIAQIDRLLAA